MLLQAKLRLGEVLIFIGSILALVGQCFIIGNPDPTQGGWFLAMGLVVFGVLVLLYGLNLFAQLSDQVNLLALLGSALLFLGGLLTIVGTIAVNMVLVPLLLRIAAIIATTVNAPGAAAQSATNDVTSALNTVKNGFTGFFGQDTSSSNIPQVTVPQINGLDIVNKALTELHLPSFTSISQWGHVFSSGTPLTLGCLLLGIGLLQAKPFPRLTGYVLVVAAVANIISQLFAATFPLLITVTGLLLFAAFALLGVTLVFPKTFQKLSTNLSTHSRHAAIRR